MTNRITKIEVPSTRVARCMKYSNGTRDLFVCEGHDGRVFIAEQGFAPHPAGENFIAVCLAAEAELRGVGVMPNGWGSANPATGR